MDLSAVTERERSKDTASSPPSSRHSGQNIARQATVGDAAHQERRTARNREALRRQAQSALRDSIEQDRALERHNMQAGVEKMVRSVVRKESTQDVQARDHETAQQADSSAQSRYTQEKLNSAYSSSNSEPPRQESRQSSPSQHKQQRAIEDYQQSTRNSVDRTVELVI